MNVPPHHRGKVARLPDNLRHIVNTMLRDGATYDTIIGKVREHGVFLIRSNLTRWRKGGYQDWLGQQLWLEQMSDRLQVVIEMVRNKESGMLGQLALEAASLKLFDLLRSLDTGSFHCDEAHDFRTFIRATNAVCRVTETTRRANGVKIFENPQPPGSEFSHSSLASKNTGKLAMKTETQGCSTQDQRCVRPT